MINQGSVENTTKQTAKPCFKHNSCLKACASCLCRCSGQQQQCAAEPGKHKQWPRASGAAAVKQRPNSQQTGAQVATLSLRKHNMKICTCGLVGTGFWAMPWMTRVMGHVFGAFAVTKASTSACYGTCTLRGIMNLSDGKCSSRFKYNALCVALPPPPPPPPLPPMPPAAVHAGSA